ncbi:DNA recombination protein RmuC [Endozoicomonas sp. GU-1]|uniref:DNA recombination protein RmuC n=1 Tax=Endozoicomonas sp. GU-1 TaxID=3009078 RepID=UPI0022B311C3|nr:DNA recombination protein RmuC [Endozoicomonas sp. GU-1]WBA82420.1 DNA recombination protein RmuC [Endozoicomonas sp. GU-1]WBA85354.1 DNA recombination protein RmuC [Endozoicomonas sp. GU-1]
MTLTALVVVALASLLSFAMAWFVCRQTQHSLRLQMEREVDAQHLQIAQLTDQKADLQDELTEQSVVMQEQLDAGKALLHQETSRLNELAHQHQVKVGRLEAMLISERKREAEKNRDLQDRVKELAAERSGRSQAEQRVKELETRLEEQQAQNQKALMQLQENKEALKQEFKHLAHEIFEARGKVLSDQHHEQLHSLLAPFREQLGEFRNKVEQAHREDSASRAALKQQLETMHQLNRKMTDDAENLAKALKGDKKLQGNWGEMQVETILDSSGLIKGQEYQREPNFRDEEGQNKRPDFIVHLPEGKHLIIDSKVSLVDYMAYVNAETDADRDAAMARHIQSIRNHINSLNQKDYPSLPEIKAPDFVFMFMPVEPAFISAFQYDQKLFNDAFEKRIVVVTPTTLLATLRTVANLWTIERQNANTRKLADKGRQVYDKLRVFVEKMEKLDIQLGNARTTYDDAMGTLKHGRGNLIAQADQFLALGVRVKKELPTKTLETADLEPLEAEELLALEAEAPPAVASVDDMTAPQEAEPSVQESASETAEASSSADTTEQPGTAEAVKEEPVIPPIVDNPVSDDAERYPQAETDAAADRTPDNTEQPDAHHHNHSSPDLASLEARPGPAFAQATDSLHQTYFPTEDSSVADEDELPTTPDFSVLESKLSELGIDMSSPEGELPSLEAELARLEQENPDYSWPDYEQQFRSEDTP